MHNVDTNTHLSDLAHFSTFHTIMTLLLYNQYLLKVKFYFANSFKLSLITNETQEPITEEGHFGCNLELGGMEQK